MEIGLQNLEKTSADQINSVFHNFEPTRFFLVLKKDASSTGVQNVQTCLDIFIVFVSNCFRRPGGSFLDTISKTIFGSIQVKAKFVV